MWVDAKTRHGCYKKVCKCTYCKNMDKKSEIKYHQNKSSYA